MHQSTEAPAYHTNNTHTIHRVWLTWRNSGRQRFEWTGVGLIIAVAPDGGHGFAFVQCCWTWQSGRKLRSSWLYSIVHWSINTSIRSWLGLHPSSPSHVWTRCRQARQAAFTTYRGWLRQWRTFRVCSVNSNTATRSNVWWFCMFWAYAFTAAGLRLQLGRNSEHLQQLHVKLWWITLVVEKFR